jgi:hypothetical protein
MTTNDTKTNLEMLEMFMKKPEDPRQRLLKNRIGLCKNWLAKARFPITRIKHYFTCSAEPHRMIPDEEICLILVKLKVPNKGHYYEFWIESVGKGEPLQVLSFFSKESSFQDPTGENKMFNKVLPRIIEILSRLSFEPDDFMRIARILVPESYELTIHMDKASLIEEDNGIEQAFTRLSPFTVPDLSFEDEQIQMKKRTWSYVLGIQQFSKDHPVEVVDEKQSKRSRN